MRRVVRDVPPALELTMLPRGVAGPLLILFSVACFGCTDSNGHGAAAECTVNTDCGGVLVCNQGRCIDPTVTGDGGAGGATTDGGGAGGNAAGSGGSSVGPWQELKLDTNLAANDVSTAGTTTWIHFVESSGDQRRYGVSKLGDADQWTQVWGGTTDALTISNVSAAVLLGLDSTQALVGNEYFLELVQDGAPAQQLGDGDTDHIRGLDAHDATDVWVITGTAVAHITGSNVTYACPSVSNACATGLVLAIYRDAGRLWLSFAGNSDAPAGIWSAEPSPTDATMLELTSALPGTFRAMANGWAVGEDGIAARLEATDWNAVPTGTSILLEGVAAGDDGLAWAVGNGGVLHFDGTSWHAVTEPGAPAGGHRVAVSADGTVFVTNEGRLWRRQP
jgi:hypothetical protein